MHRFIEKTSTFIHFPLKLLWLNQKEVSGLRELKAATLFPLWRVTWFPFVPWKTSWFWLFSLSGMRYNSTPAAKSPVSRRKLLHFEPSLSSAGRPVSRGAFFIIIYCFQWSEETLQMIVWNPSSDNRRGREVLVKEPSFNRGELCPALARTTYGSHLGWV